MTPLLKCSHLTKDFGGFSLKDIDFPLESGYLTGVIGKNGSGKTALLKILAGLDQHFEGDIEIQGISLKDDPAAAKELIGYVSDELQPFWEKTALENGSILGPYFKNYDESYYKKWLERMGVDVTLPIHQLSKGNRMKYFCCLALSHHPRLLILDEPSAGFDPVFRREFLSILQELLEDMAVVMASHVTEDLDKVADYILYLEDGCLVRRESIEQLRASDYKRKLSDSFLGDIHIYDLLDER
ncbi:ABC transporter ATP-binding protein [Blautia schinkii]|nr:ABC transporter ATP-binding protein [Blautia schinkii]